ncbi:hypothetical protein FTX61_19170 [Nitriliruptoraceae bacterium ZYF776]|nr:hypothetical protein [Profundirhabdus halotolerans]
MRMRSRDIAAGLLALSLAVTACGGPELDPADEETETVDEAPEPEEPVEDEEPLDEAPDEPEEDEPTDDAPEPTASGDATPPGTELSIGEPAVVDVSTEDGTVQLEVVVESIEEGSLDQLEEAGFEIDATLQGQVPYYLTYRATSLAEDTLGYASVSTNFRLLLEDDSEANPLSLIGSFEPCPVGDSFLDAEPGDEISGCRVFVVPESVETGAAAYRDFDFDTLDDPIRWVE